MRLDEILEELVAIANEFDEDSDRAAKLGYQIEFAMGPFVQVDVNLLRELRDELQRGG